MMRARLFCAWGWLTLPLLACSATPPAPAPAVSAPALYHGELTDFVPAAGLRWLVAGSPARLAQQPALASLRARWLTEQRRRAFAAATGIDVLATERGLVAGFELGTLYMADASGWVARPERLFARRLAGSELLRQPHPQLWRVTGLVGTRPEALVRVADELVAVAVGDLTLARVVELRAQRRLDKVPSAFQGAALSTLPEEALGPSSFALYLPGPLDAEWVTAGAGLLGAAHALAISIDVDEARVELQLFIAGRWDTALDGARLAERWRAFAESSLGRQLALDRPVVPLDVRASDRLLHAYTHLDASALSAGVEALLVGNLDDLLRFEDSSGAPAAPP